LFITRRATYTVSKCVRIFVPGLNLCLYFKFCLGCDLQWAISVKQTRINIFCSHFVWHMTQGLICIDWLLYFVYCDLLSCHFIGLGLYLTELPFKTNVFTDEQACFWRSRGSIIDTLYENSYKKWHSWDLLQKWHSWDSVYNKLTLNRRGFCCQKRFCCWKMSNFTPYTTFLTIFTIYNCFCRFLLLKFLWPLKLLWPIKQSNLLGYLSFFLPCLIEI